MTLDEAHRYIEQYLLFVEHKEMMEYFKKCAKEVATWPIWKRGS